MFCFIIIAIRLILNVVIPNVCIFNLKIDQIHILLSDANDIGASLNYLKDVLNALIELKCHCLVMRVRMNQKIIFILLLRCFLAG
jgi:hypothetical protein